MYADKHAWLLFPIRRSQRPSSKVKNPCLEKWTLQDLVIKIGNTKQQNEILHSTRKLFTLLFFYQRVRSQQKWSWKNPFAFVAGMKVGQRWTVYHFILLWECILVLHTLQMEYKRFLLKERFWQCFCLFLEVLMIGYRKLRRKGRPTILKLSRCFLHLTYNYMFSISSKNK